MLRFDAVSATPQLLELCLVEGDLAEWGENEIEAIGEQLAAADPLAEILLDFECPVCGDSFQEALDLSAFFWTELEGRSKRLLLDVHTLASAYGWSEAQVLELEPSEAQFLPGTGAGVSGYLHRLAASAIQPQPRVHPFVESIYPAVRREKALEFSPVIQAAQPSVRASSSEPTGQRSVPEAEAPVFAQTHARHGAHRRLLRCNLRFAWARENCPWKRSLRAARPFNRYYPSL